MRDLKAVATAGRRVIEFAAKGGILGNQMPLPDSCLTVNKEGIPTARHDVTRGGAGFYAAIRKNSAELLVLSCVDWRALKALQDAPQVRHSFVRITLLQLPALVYFLVKWIALGRQKYDAMYHVSHRAFYLGLRRQHPSPQATRHYLSPLIPLDTFFQNLNDRGVRYCILRWWESLPALEPGEDVDLLVDDGDIATVHGLVDQRPGLVPFDIYSKSGLPGSDYKQIPYYMPALADLALQEVRLFKDCFKVPTSENGFYLLAYHAVFHKGPRSGFTSRLDGVSEESRPEHDYASSLQHLAREANLQIDDWSLEGLHSFLEARGYAPPLDTLYKLSVHNHYLQAHLTQYHPRSEVLNTYKGLVCFVAREKIIEAGLLEQLAVLIRREGFTILRTVPIHADAQERFQRHVRGGNWNQGPWPGEGGKPAVLVVALDLYPIEVNPEDHDLHPGLSNQRIRRKTAVRDALNARFLDPQEWCNGLHSSDNEIQALEYLTLAGVDADATLREMRAHQRAFATQGEVLEVMSRYSRRAKVEVIEHLGELAVKKTFKPDCERFLANEVLAHALFKDSIPMPELLEVGSNYLISKYVTGARPLGTRITARTLRRCLRLLRVVYDHGYSLLDFKPGNFLVDRQKRLYLIDFEFLYKYEERPDFWKAYDLLAIPEGLDPLMVPDNYIPQGLTRFDALWGAETGIRYEELPQLERFLVACRGSLRYYWRTCSQETGDLLKRVKRRLGGGLRALPWP